MSEPTPKPPTLQMECAVCKQRMDAHGECWCDEPIRPWDPEMEAAQA